MLSFFEVFPDLLIAVQVSKGFPSLDAEGRAKEILDSLPDTPKYRLIQISNQKIYEDFTHVASAYTFRIIHEIPG